MNHRRSRLALSLFSALVLLLSLLLFTAPPARSAAILYVDSDAPGPTHDGTSWASAYASLQSALAVAESGDQLWVAQGRYTPGPAASPTSTFTIPDGVQVYGGFAGGETSLSQRDPAAHPTVLSGDLAGDDTVDMRGVTLTASNIVGPNAYHVLTVNGVTSATVIDGVIITGGDARTGAASAYGGGLYATSSGLLLQGVAFIGNAAASGGAVYLYGGTPTLADARFEGNVAVSRGGAVLLQTSTPRITGAVFRGNTAVDGGAVASLASAPTMTNLAFGGNTASNRGGALYIYGGSPVLTNVTIAANTGVDGTALYLGNTATPTLTNTILWGNEPSASAPIFVQSGTPTISYSLVQGGYVGTGNLDADPLFVDLAAGDLHLLQVSPAIDAGLDAAVPEGVTTDLAGTNRFIDGDGDSVPTVDMGAYEYGASTGTATLTVGTVNGIVGADEIRVPITIDLEGGAALGGADLQLSYDAALLRASRVETGAQTAGWSLAYNVATPGQIQFSMAHTSDLISDGELAVLVFSAVMEGTATIGWGTASLNEGDIAATLVDGAATLYAAPTADFSATPTSGPAPLSVTFTSGAAGGYDAVSWDFGDGGTSTETNPSHVYDTPGTYTVSLTVSGPGGTATATETDYITVYAPAVSDFSAAPLDGLAPLEVVFTNASTGDISTYEWGFGDGTTSAEQNPTHTYPTEGIYTVFLTVDGLGGSSTVTKTALVTVRLGDITGSVMFWNEARPLSGASLVLSGDAMQTVYSQVDGTYSQGGLSRGAYTVTPGDGADDGGAISAYDASLVLQHAAGLRTLADQAYTAGDVTLNGAPTAYDAAFILRKAAGLIPLASPDAGVAWQFEPASREYPTFTESVADQDFTALLLGDVSGNWGAGAEPAALAVLPVAELALSSGSVDATGLVTVTLALESTEAPMYSLMVDLGTGDAVLQSVWAGEQSDGWLLATREPAPGRVRLAMAGARPAQTAGSLVHMAFRLPPGLAAPQLTPLAAEIDEGAMVVIWPDEPPAFRVWLPLVRR